MTQYKIRKGCLDKKYIVQSRPDWWPIWKEILPQRFDTLEEAQGLLKIFEDVDRIPLSSSKARSRNLVTHGIRRLTTRRAYFEKSGSLDIARLYELDQELDRLRQVYRKLLEKGCIC